MCTLILLVHLNGYPTMQHRERMIAVPAMLCAMRGQEVAAEWVNEHEGWTVLGWRCAR